MFPQCQLYSIKFFLALALTCCLYWNSFSQGRIWFSELGVDIKQQQKIQYTGGSVNKSPALGYFANINSGGKKIAVGLQVDYLRVDLKNINTAPAQKGSLHLWEFYFGLRYYPLIPTFKFGIKGAIRFTAGGQVGFSDFYWRENDTYNYPTYSHRSWSPAAFSSVVFAGLCFSPFRNTSGLSVKLNYRPQTYSMKNFPLKNFALKQPFSLSAALFIGPRIKS